MISLCLFVCLEFDFKVTWKFCLICFDALRFIEHQIFGWQYGNAIRYKNKSCKMHETQNLLPTFSSSNSSQHSHLLFKLLKLMWKALIKLAAAASTEEELRVIYFSFFNVLHKFIVKIYVRLYIAIFPDQKCRLKHLEIRCIRDLKLFVWHKLGFISRFLRI